MSADRANILETGTQCIESKFDDGAPYWRCSSSFP
jgi:hypothetical protein